MSQTAGQTFTSLHGTRCQLGPHLGSGGQGSVWSCRYGGVPHALKWYASEATTPAQYQRILDLITAGSPSPSFAWPLDLLQTNQGFGYIMPLIDRRMVSIHELVHAPVAITCVAACRFTTALAQAFRDLHLKGHCYRDVSDNNIFVNPADGTIMIIDNDNVAPVGQPVAVVGTPGFMSPEVVRDFSCQKPVLLNALTDYHSLAVLLFHLWVCGHPLYGARETACNPFALDDMIRLTGTDPLFVFDPQDRRNRPVAGPHDGMIAAWPLLSPRLRSLFTRAFTVGLADPGQRVTEREWIAAACEAEGHLYPCVACGAERFYDLELLQQNRKPPCPGCRKPMPLPPRMRIGQDRQHRCDVMLTRGRTVRAWQVDPGLNDPTSPEGREAVAEVVESTQQPGLWGLRNLGTMVWTCSEAGKTKSCPPGHAVALTDGLHLAFGPPGSPRLSGMIKAG